MKKAGLRFLSTMLTAALVMSLLVSCDDQGYYYDDEEYDDNSDSSIVTSSGQGVVEVGDAEPGTWLVMLYQDADDETLERDIFLDLNEAEIVGSSDMVTIVSQMDRYDGDFDGDGDWTSTKRFLVGQDDDLETIGSEELDDLGEMDMSDPRTLSDFMIWAIQSYPSEHYVLILSDHGMGWLGGWTDPDPMEGDMSLSEIDSALSTVVNATGIGQLDLLGFDACLMAQLETMSMAAPYARYAVASEETEPAVGWAYAAFLGELVNNPAMSGAELAKAVVDSYITEDYRITDDDARVSFVEENYESGADMSAAEVADDMSIDITMSALDLSKIAALNEAMNDLALALQDADQSGVAASRSYAQSYTSVFDKGIPDSFIDLGSFAELAADETGDANVANAAQQVQSALSQVVLVEKHGYQKPGSTGLAFYYPNSELYEMTTDEDFGSYTSIADRFAAASLWDDFLAFHYTGKAINAAAADLSVLGATAATETQDFSEAIAASAPEEGVQVESPGRGEATIGEVTSTAYELYEGESATISADVSGTNIAYLYFYVNYYDEYYQSYLMSDIYYLNADTIKEVAGLKYPDWGDGEEFPVEFEWLPTVYYLSDGYEETFVYLEPETYGETYEEDVYTLYGLYYPGGDESKEQEAMIRFDGNFELKSFWVFTGSDGTGAPREATLEDGDTFIPWELWQDYNADTEEWEYTYYLGETELTFTGEPFVVWAYDAYVGTYEVGFRAEDYDGNIVAESYTEITIPE